MGLIVQLKPSEAKEMIPKIKDLIKDKMDRIEKDIQQIQVVKQQFEDNYGKLQLALNPLIKDLERLEQLYG